MDNCPRLDVVEQKQMEHSERIAVLEAGHERHEENQLKMSSTMEAMCRNVSRLADSVDKLVELVPLLNAANGIRAAAVWITPIMAAMVTLATITSGVYWALTRAFGHG